MTVRAGVHQNTWDHVDWSEAVRPTGAFLKKVTPFVLAVVMVGSTIFFAMSCKGSTVAFSNDGKVASLNVEVADDPAERAKGLMGRKDLPPDSGLLFDFARETTTGFWMKDTTIPLSIAFIGSDGRVIAIEDMEPNDLTPVRPETPYRYAIETNRGWFAENGIAPGFNVSIDI